MVPRARLAFMQAIPSAFVYPFTQNGLFTVLACGIMFSALNFTGILGAVVARAALPVRGHPLFVART
jgi:hypothetical protein